MGFGVNFDMFFKNPGEPQYRQIVTKLRRALTKEAQIQKRMLQKTTKTWRGTKPKFRSLTEVTSEGITIFIFPTGSEMAVNKFIWLDQGTKERWAVMSRGWRSKTQTRVLGSRGGRGRVVIAGRKAMRRRNIGVRPGIQARMWTQEVVKRRERRFVETMQRDLDLAVEGLYP
jgi:hypothetical protein